MEGESGAALGVLKLPWGATELGIKFPLCLGSALSEGEDSVKSLGPQAEREPLPKHLWTPDLLLPAESTHGSA